MPEKNEVSSTEDLKKSNGVVQDTKLNSGNGVVDGGPDNVLDLEKDEKFRLQMELKEMERQLLKQVVNSSDPAKNVASKLHGQYEGLTNRGAVSYSELKTIRDQAVTDYTTARISNTNGQADTQDQNTAEATQASGNANEIIQKTNLNQLKGTSKGNKGEVEYIAKTAQEIEEDIKRGCQSIDKRAEEKYKQWQPYAQMNPEQQDISFSGFAQDLVNEVNKQVLTTEELATKTYRFHLNNLKQAVLSSGATVSGNSIPNGNGSIDQHGQGGQVLNGNIEISDYRNLHKEAYETSSLFSDAIKGVKSYDIYKEDRMKQVMSTILNVDKSILKNGVFGINLSAENGFAAVLKKIGNGEQANLGGYSFTIEGTGDQQRLKLLTTPTGPREDGKITGDDLRAMKKAGILNYEHEKGFLQRDDEFVKMANIINNVKWTDLSTFVTLSDAKSDQSTILREYANTKNNIALCTSVRVFDFLCDKDGDGYVGNNKEKQKNKNVQTDVGLIFGPQLKWSIDQAAKTETALHDPDEKQSDKDGTTYGEKVVIQNIMKNIDLQDTNFKSLLSTPADAQILAAELAMYRDHIGDCTRTNLSNTVHKYPAFKALFGAAIAKINGNSSVLAPDLSDNLRGNTINRFMEEGNWKFRADLEKKIDSALISKFNKKEIDTDIIKTRETFLTKIMNIADGFTIVGSDTKEGYLRNPGISKEFVNKQAKEAFINDLTNQALNSIAVGAFTGQSTIRIPVDFIRQGHSESGRTLWKIQAGPSVGYDREKQDIVFTVGVGGEIAEQYNYAKVINAPLDEVKSAKYIGAEGQAIAGASLKNLNIGAEASIGVLREQSPVMGINQINRQYESVSSRLFKVGASDLTSYESIYDALKKNITTVNDSYQKFVSTNTERLLSNADFIVSFLKVNNVLDSTKDVSAINELISMLQEANMEEWRSDLLNNLNNKFDITKLSFGLTTSAIKAEFGNKTGGASKTEGGSSSLGTDKSTDVDGKEMNSFTNPGKSYKFGIFGFYVGARISNWKTTYGINDRQLANTRYEIAEGKNTDKVNFKTPEQYAKYLSALFNNPELKIQALNNKIIITNIGKTKLPELLNIRVTDATKKQVRYDTVHDILTIGNVQDIGAYTTAEPDGVVRQLVIGSKNYKDGKPLDYLTTRDNNPDQIQMKETGRYEAVSLENIQTLANGIENQADRDIILKCFATNGQLINTLPNNVVVNGTDKTIKAGTTINIIKDKQGKYTLSLEQGTGDKVKLRFADGEKFAKGEVIDFKSTKYHVESPAIKAKLDDLQTSDYANLEKNTQGGLSKDFRIFMETCDSDLGKASASLWRMIPNKGKFVEIKKTLETARVNKDEKTQRYLVDQFKGLFAYETSYEGKSISRIFVPRQSHFLTLLNGASENLKNSLLETRTNILKEGGSENYTKLREKTETIPELFGYTAFYRKYVGHNGQKMSLVSTADTTVLPVGGKTHTPLEGNTGTEAKDWILNNLDKNNEQKALLLDSILSNIKDENTRKLFAEEIGMEDLKSILKGEPFVLENGTKKLVLNTEPAFYFKGECANESLGLLIKNLEIQEAPVSAAEVKKELVVDNNFNTRSHSVGATPDIQENSVNGRYNKSLKTKTQTQQGDGSSTGAGSDDEGTGKDTDAKGTSENNF